MLIIFKTAFIHVTFSLGGKVKTNLNNGKLHKKHFSVEFRENKYVID